MLWIFGALIFISSIALGVIVLIQNPKGGGLTSSLGSIGNQFMGVRQTNDVLEKGTWIFAGIIAFLSITSTLFIPKSAGPNSSQQIFQEAPVGQPLAPQGNTQQLPAAPSQQSTTPQPSQPVPPPAQ